MKIALLIVASVIPSLLLLWYFYKRDRNPEPCGILMTSYGLGIGSMIPTVGCLVALVVFVLQRTEDQLPDYILSASLLGLVFAFVSQFCCFMILKGYCARQKAFDEPMDGIVYGAAVGAGASAFFAIFSAIDERNWQSLGLLSITILPLFTCLGAIMGHYVARNKFGSGGKPSPWIGYLISSLLLALYLIPQKAIDIQDEQLGEHDVFDDLDTPHLAVIIGTTVLTVAVLIWTLRLVQKLRAEQKNAAVLPPATSPSA